MIVLFRVVNRQVERVRVFSEDCQLDAGGREITWLTASSRRERRAARVAGRGPALDERRDRIVDGSISAIALHEDASATAALERLLGASQPQQVRAKVPFWLGNTRGRRGLEILQRVVKEDPAVEVKKKAVFGISQSREPQAVDVLIENAKTNPDTAVRSESIFWLAQKAGNKAAAAITERIEQDPDTEVKKKAVFALSQLPKDEGVPLLIQVARTHSNPAVRKQAMFWLGQSKDPRALALFAEIPEVEAPLRRRAANAGAGPSNDSLVRSAGVYSRAGLVNGSRVTTAAPRDPRQAGGWRRPTSPTPRRRRSDRGRRRR
jgi:hypothetical protein